MSFCKDFSPSAMATRPEAAWPLNPPVTHVKETRDVTFAASTRRHLTSTCGGLERSSLAFNHEEMSENPNVFHVKINARRLWQRRLVVQRTPCRGLTRPAPPHRPRGDLWRVYRKSCDSDPPTRPASLLLPSISRK